MWYTVCGMSYDSNYLAHHGVKGMTWHSNRWWTPDHKLTPEGRRHYGYGEERKPSPGAVTVQQGYRNLDKKAKKIIRKADVAKAIGFAASPFTLGLSSVAADLAVGKQEKKINELLYGNKKEEDGSYTNELKGKEVVIPKGTEMVRFSSVENEGAGSDSKDRIYVSFNEDNFTSDYYEKVWPKYLKKLTGNDNLDYYAKTFEVNTELLAPDYETRKAAVEAVMSSNKKVLEEVGKEYCLSQMRISGETSMANTTLKQVEKELAERNTNLFDALTKQNPDANPKGYTREQVAENYKKSAKEQIKNRVKQYIEYFDSNRGTDDAFKRFVSVIPASSKLMGLYIKELKKQGFNCVFDDNANSPAPFIVFDPDMITQTTVKKIL